MNYRHHYHAGNFADVMKHALLIRLFRALQKKDQGFLFLDTHAGRGRYDLTTAAQGDTQTRKPEWPDGVGRLWALASIPQPLAEYVTLVRDFDRRMGNLDATARFYPGSPWLARLLARPQDRLAFWEQNPPECAALRAELGGAPGVSISAGDGYNALRALLPPPERRALVLIDPPFEDAAEFTRIAAALAEGLHRFPSGVLAIWYPLTGRADRDALPAALRAMKSPPALVAELTIAGPATDLKMKGCGLVVINPPWQFDHEAREVLECLAKPLAQAPGGGGRVAWLVERP